MIMQPGQQLLLPARPAFIWASLIAALILNMAPNMAGLGRAPWLPDFLALTLVFWSVHQPRRVGIGSAFAFGLLMDVHQSSLLGQHALAYTLLVFVAGAAARRLTWFSSPVQALHMLPLFAAVHAVQVLLRMAANGSAPGWIFLVAPLVEALLWPLVTRILLAPQRRAPDSDENRPL